MFSTCSTCIERGTCQKHAPDFSLEAEPDTKLAGGRRQRLKKAKGCFHTAMKTDTYQALNQKLVRATLEREVAEVEKPILCRLMVCREQNPSRGRSLQQYATILPLKTFALLSASMEEEENELSPKLLNNKSTQGPQKS